ncbi:UNVERIFIED_CONTAM: hypothetical protein K2H54_013540, partial [Gekko kuhli]
KVSSFDLTQGFPIYSNNVYNEEAGHLHRSASSFDIAARIGINLQALDVSPTTDHLAVDLGPVTMAVSGPQDVHTPGAILPQLYPPQLTWDQRQLRYLYGVYPPPPAMPCRFFRLG